MYLQILRWFDDSAGLSAPFSLHTLVDIGTRAGKNVGDWYGPSSVAYVLREALDWWVLKLNFIEVFGRHSDNSYHFEKATTHTNR